MMFACVPLSPPDPKPLPPRSSSHLAYSQDLGNCVYSVREAFCWTLVEYWKKHTHSVFENWGEREGERERER